MKPNLTNYGVQITVWGTLLPYSKKSVIITMTAKSVKKISVALAESLQSCVQ